MTREEAINNLKKVLGFSPTYDKAFYTLFPNGAEPSLPEGLDEAAEEYQEQVKAHFLRTLEHPSAKDAFKSGAEWMAAQGVNYELEVKADAGGYPYIDKTFELYDYTEEKNIFNPGDKVIVQIRKK